MGKPGRRSLYRLNTRMIESGSQNNVNITVNRAGDLVFPVRLEVRETGQFREARHEAIIQDQNRMKERLRMLEGQKPLTSLTP